MAEADDFPTTGYTLWIGPQAYRGFDPPMHLLQVDLCQFVSSIGVAPGSGCWPRWALIGIGDSPDPSLTVA